jgi:hypothetical protein
VEFNQRSASGGIATREAKLKQEPAQVKAVIRATFEVMDFNRREKTWMVNYIQTKWKLTPKIAEESYRTWLNGFTNDGKIPFKDLQEIYDAALASQLIPTAVPVPESNGLHAPGQSIKGKKIIRGQSKGAQDGGSTFC